jgi:hypothetical protein
MLNRRRREGATALPSVMTEATWLAVVALTDVGIGAVLR